MPTAACDPIGQAITAIKNMRRWARKNEAAPHKPLLIMLALARVQDGAPRFVDFNEVEQPLRELLQRFGPERAHLHPEYPFWRLQNDGLWVVVDAETFPSRQSNTDPPISVLRSRHAHGGFTEDLDKALRQDPARLRLVAETVASTFFPDDEAEVLCAVGLL